MNTRTSFPLRTLHAVLEVFAVGLFGASVVFDLVEHFLPAPPWALVARWNLEAGIAIGVIAAGLALAAHVEIGPTSRASRARLTYVGMSFAVLALFGASLVIRSQDRPESWAIAASSLAFGLLVASTWLGAELRRSRIEDEAAL